MAFFERLAAIAGRRFYISLILWPIVALVLMLTVKPLEQVADDTQLAQLGPGTDHAQAMRLLAEGFSGENYNSSAVVIFVNDLGLSDEDRAFAAEVVRWLRSPQGPSDVQDVISPETDPVLGKRLVSADGKAMIVKANLSTTFIADRTKKIIRAIREKAAEGPAGLKVYVTGDAAIGSDYGTAVNESLRRTTVVTLALVVVILVLIYRSPITPLVPLGTVALSFLISRGVIATYVAMGMTVPTMVETFLVVILFGAGTDYCLFLTARYREELARSGNYDEAVEKTLKAAGAPVLASALTTIVGLGSMAFAQFSVFRVVGPCLATGLLVTVCASLTFAPAFLRLLGPWVFWPALYNQRRAYSTFWRRIGNLVVKFPVATLAAALLILAPLAFWGTKATPSYDIVSELPESKPSVVAYRIFQAHFKPGDLMPVTLVLRSQEDLRTPRGLDLLRALTEQVKREPPVGGVLSISQPRGLPEETKALLASSQLELVSNGLEKALTGVRNFTSAQSRPAAPIMLQIGLLETGLKLMKTSVEGMRGLISPGEGGWGDRLVVPQSLLTGDDPKAKDFRKALDYYISPDGHIARLEIGLTPQPYSQEAMDSLENLRQSVDGFSKVVPLRIKEFHFTGATARINDIRHLTQNDIKRIKVLVVAGVLAVLILQFRWVLTALYLVGTMILSYFATLGVTLIVFIHILGEPGLDWKVQYLMFVLLIALGVDYNIFIMSRIKEERSSSPPELAIRRSIMVTGRIITSCGIIMAGTFGSMMVSRLAVMIQLGFAIGFGVLLDTFLMRPIVVPAIAALVERFKISVTYTPPSIGRRE